MRAAIVVNGVVTNIIEVESLTDWPGAIDAGNAGPGWTFAGGVFTPPNTVPIVALPITATQFLALFTDQERMAIVTGAQSNPQLMLLLITMASASSIDMTDPAVRAGLQSLVPGVLSQARVTEILG